MSKIKNGLEVEMSMLTMYCGGGYLKRENRAVFIFYLKDIRMTLSSFMSSHPYLISVQASKG